MSGALEQINFQELEAREELGFSGGIVQGSDFISPIVVLFASPFRLRREKCKDPYVSPVWVPNSFLDTPGFLKPRRAPPRPEAYFPPNQYLVLPRGRFGVFINVSPFTNAGLGSLTLDCWGITFVKIFQLKATLPRACMVLGDLRSAGEALKVPDIYLPCLVLLHVSLCHQLLHATCLLLNHFGLVWSLSQKKMFGLPPRFGEFYCCEFFWWFINVVLWRVDFGGGGVVCAQLAFELAPS